mmetsp:Transcript_460/g.563  ORF Transcript_460/g.563 Transcript_460/m.563 type:complete len:450 (-) Transcript_460:49-1398(-)|eukprot:CAMPEP_0178905600 /NCGR_PEP_ID=MMETSP0786-20121207/6366_1 /TAXON_ID=186022 /ORGANISM="Thalassionema frauenfeldii, Strain CCMP 1798" /LENGTH=449 /DNA_ID=CAMNT_0020577227 /DNA_START=75 /DNA_END=1424 /DNA_ORIENTATION=+
MDELPLDILKTLLHFITDDPVSIARFELTCQSHCKLVRSSPELFQEMLVCRWMRGNKCAEIESNPRKEFARRYKSDQIAIKCVKSMAQKLRIELGEHASSMNDFPRLGQSWNNPNWKLLLELRLDVYDILRSMANASIDYNEEILEQNLRRFIAARAVVGINMSQCLIDWKNMTSSSDGTECRATQIEKFALLAAKAQMTPPELLDESCLMETNVADKLDEIANKCGTVMASNNVTSNKEKIRIVSEIMFGDMGFTGNNDDYYNYKNSLLNHVLTSKKGIPMTLAVIFTCISRRLNIDVDMIGLPGHLVLGFFDDSTNKQHFLDVYRGGTLMGLEECQRIAASYGFGWDDNFVRPLAPVQVVTRILNNLTNCHSRMPILSAPALFRETLMHQVRQLMLAHQMPAIVEQMLMNRDHPHPLTMSIDLLKLYGLLHANDGSVRSLGRRITRV